MPTTSYHDVKPVTLTMLHRHTSFAPAYTHFYHIYLLHNHYIHHMIYQLSSFYINSYSLFFIVYIFIPLTIHVSFFMHTRHTSTAFHSLSAPLLHLTFHFFFPLIFLSSLSLYFTYYLFVLGNRTSCTHIYICIYIYTLTHHHCSLTHDLSFGCASFIRVHQRGRGVNLSRWELI